MSELGPQSELPGEVRVPATLSVGELLGQADVVARMLMVDVDGRAAPAMVRAWPRVVEAAAEVWRAMPVEYPAIDNRDRLDVDRLQALSHGLHLSMIRRHSYPAADGDRRLEQMVALYDRAHALLEKFGDEVGPVTSDAARHDMSAAKMRIVHGLHVAGHAVASSVRAHLDVVDNMVRGPRQVAQRQLGPLLLQRLDAFEQLTTSYVAGRYATVVARAAPDPSPAAERAEQALTQWQLRAHATLAAGGHAIDSVLVAQGMLWIAETAAVLTEAGSRGGVWPTDSDRPGRLGPTLVAAQRDWADLAGQWADLAAFDRRPTPALQAAQMELRAALEVLSATVRPELGQVVAAQRGDAAAVERTAERALASGTDLAHALADRAAVDTGLRAPAKLMNERTAAITRGQRAWIAVSDNPNRPVPITPPVRARLVRAAERAAASTSRSAAEAARAITRHAGPTAVIEDRLAHAQALSLMATAAIRRTAVPGR